MYAYILYNIKTGEFYKRKKGGWTTNCRGAGIWTTVRYIRRIMNVGKLKNEPKGDLRIRKFELIDIRPLLHCAKYVYIYPIHKDSNKILLVYKKEIDYHNLERHYFSPVINQFNLIGGRRLANFKDDISIIKHYTQLFSNLECNNFCLSGVVHDTAFNVLSTYYTCNALSNNKPLNITEIEHVDWYDWNEMKFNPQLLNNLNVIVPLIKNGIQWTIKQNYDNLTVNIVRDPISHHPLDEFEGLQE